MSGWWVKELRDTEWRPLVFLSLREITSSTQRRWISTERYRWLTSIPRPVEIQRVDTLFVENLAFYNLKNEISPTKLLHLKTFLSTLPQLGYLLGIYFSKWAVKESKTRVPWFWGSLSNGNVTFPTFLNARYRCVIVDDSGQRWEHCVRETFFHRKYPGSKRATRVPQALSLWISVKTFRLLGLRNKMWWINNKLRNHKLRNVFVSHDALIDWKMIPSWYYQQIVRVLGFYYQKVELVKGKGSWKNLKCASGLVLKSISFGEKFSSRIQFWV